MHDDLIDKEFLNKNKHLKIIAVHGTGFNNVDIDAATKLGIPIGTTGDILSHSTADLTVGLILNVARLILQSTDSLRRNPSEAYQPERWIGQSLRNKTIGIVGMG